MASEVNRRAEIRANVHTERALIAKLEAKITHGSIKQLLRSAKYSLDDVEFLLRSAQQAQPAYVSMWLHAAEANVKIAAQHRKVVERIVAKYGPDAVAI